MNKIEKLEEQLQQTKDRLKKNETMSPFYRTESKEDSKYKLEKLIKYIESDLSIELDLQEGR